MRFFFFALESNDDDSDESDDNGSGSEFTSGLFFSLCFELSIDQVILLLSSRVLSSRVPIFSIFWFNVSCSKTSLVSKFRISNMFAIRYLLAYSFSIVMRMRHPIFPVRGPTDPVWVFYSGSDDTIDQVPYILYINGRVP